MPGELSTLTKAEVGVQTMALHDLATDCLRFIMHFFHPIQQCAQQVHHTALPLSPTSSQMRESCLQSVTDSHLSCVVAFSGAPSNWGLLLRTIDMIDVRPRHLTYITTSVQKIISVSEDIVNIYDAVTGVPLQSLCTPETVIKADGSPDGSILFFAHSSSVTMWDVQTGGLIHTLATQSEINDIAVSTNHMACGLSDGSVAFWNIQTKEAGKGFGNSEPVMAIYWLSPQELAVATQSSFYIHDVTIGETSGICPVPGCVWGMVYLEDEGRFLVGTSQPVPGPDALQVKQFFIPFIPRSSMPPMFSPLSIPLTSHVDQQLSSPKLVGEEIVCMSPPIGVRSFNTRSRRWTHSPPPLDTATSVAVSLNRDLVVQTKDSIRIYSASVLAGGVARYDVRRSYVYPLGEKHIVCLQPNMNLVLLELETLRVLRPNDDAPSLRPLYTDELAARASFGRGLVAAFGVSAVLKAWQSGKQFPKWTAASEGDTLYGWSPTCTRVATIHSSLPGSRHPILRIRDRKRGFTLADLTLEHDDVGEVYDITFSSETMFYLKMEGPGRHIQIPHKITALRSGGDSYTITKGEPEPLSEPRQTIPPYTLDAKCEWVIDTESRKVCWIPPGNLRRGGGGYFWSGVSLVIVGDDGVVRKLTFKEPDRQSRHMYDNITVV